MPLILISRTPLRVAEQQQGEDERNRPEDAGELVLLVQVEEQEKEERHDESDEEDHSSSGDHARRRGCKPIRDRSNAMESSGRFMSFKIIGASSCSQHPAPVAGLTRTAIPEAETADPQAGQRRHPCQDPCWTSSSASQARAGIRHEVSHLRFHGSSISDFRLLHFWIECQLIRSLVRNPNNSAIENPKWATPSGLSIRVGWESIASWPSAGRDARHSCVTEMDPATAHGHRHSTLSRARSADWLPVSSPLAFEGVSIHHNIDLRLGPVAGRCRRCRRECGHASARARALRPTCRARRPPRLG